MKLFREPNLSLTIIGEDCCKLKQNQPYYWKSEYGIDTYICFQRTFYLEKVIRRVRPQLTPMTEF